MLDVGGFADVAGNRLNGDRTGWIGQVAFTHFCAVCAVLFALVCFCLLLNKEK